MTRIGERLSHHILLIGGTSHAGKSTLARFIAERRGWACVSTDSLGRHPGRPWRTPPEVVPEHVAAYYLDLTLEAQIISVMAHYRGMAPTIAALVADHRARGEGLVLEGSGVLPDTMAGLKGAAAIWLTADEALLTDRILAEGAHATRDAQGRRLIEAFAARARRFNGLMRDEVTRLGLAEIRVEPGLSVEALTDQVLRRIGVDRAPAP